MVFNYLICISYFLKPTRYIPFHSFKIRSSTIFILNFCCVMVSLLSFQIDVHSVNSVMTIHYWLWKWIPGLYLWLELVIRANLLWNGLKQWEGCIINDAKATSRYWSYIIWSVCSSLFSMPIWILLAMSIDIHSCIFPFTDEYVFGANIIQYK